MVKVNPERRTITPEKAVRSLKRYGRKVTKAEARLILDFMYNFAILSVNQTLKDNRIKKHENR